MSMQLRPFQNRVLQEQLKGNNVLLQAPTGAGKTRAALAPYLLNLAQGKFDLPTTCRYAVPMRVLANQFHQEYKDIKFADIPALHAFTQAYKQLDKPPVSIQTGEQPDDPIFESALTFCTIDQLLASFLGIPYGLGKRQANINVAAIAGSYLILDEFHLYPLGPKQGNIYGARTTALQMLRLLNQSGKRLSPFTLMSATFSSKLLDRLANLLSAVIVNVESQASQPGQASELEELMQGRSRRFFVESQAMQAEQIIEQHQDCSLVICNTVNRAQLMYQELRNRLEQQGSNTQVVLLHSRFTVEDRRAKQAFLEANMGPSQWQGNHYTGANLIVVATQVVEVGIDISARILHSEIAPASSIIQRAGRCARFKQQQGNVHLYPLSDGSSYLPYRKEICIATLDAFRQFQAQIIDFTHEQAIIDIVHTAEDSAMLDQFLLEQGKLNEKIFNTLASHNRADASELIRDVQQVSVAIHSDPNTALTKRPWEAQLFSLSPYALIGKWEDLTNRSVEAGPIWQAQLNEQQNPETERLEQSYSWDVVQNPASLKTALFLTLSPEIASYTSELGLQLRPTNSPLPWPSQVFESKIQPKAKRFFAANYDQETYLEHIQGLLNAFNQSRIKEDSLYIAQQLEALLSLQPKAIHQAIRLAIACHDIAKLSTGWQDWAHAWQELLLSETGDTHYAIRKAPFAHTDSTPELQKQHGKKIKLSRPHHACESAKYALPIIYEATKDLVHDPKNIVLTQASVAAIARHHSSTSTTYAAQPLIPTATQHINAALEACHANYSLSKPPKPIEHNGELSIREILMPRQENPLGTWLYFVIVRALRLADQRSFRFRD